MNLYHILVFFHISGTIMLFITWSMEYAQVNKIKTTLDSHASVGNPCSVQKKGNRKSMVAMIVTLATGIWLMLLQGYHAAWMLMAMVALVLIIVIGLSLFRAASKTGSGAGRRYQLLALSIRLRLSTGFGIIALMVFKPFLFWEALLMIVLALAAGMIWFWTTRNLTAPAGHREQKMVSLR
jgi:hypothetical protein